MVAAPEYSVAVQAKLIHALCVLHNFIRIHDPDDMKDAEAEELERIPQAPGAADFGGNISSSESERASEYRDQVAKAMWADYVAYLARAQV